MKRLTLIAFLLTAPLAVMAQIPVFTDNFNSGSTLNGISTNSGTTTASATSYDIAATKATSTGTFLRAGGTNVMRFSLNAVTTSGLIEAQAIFAGGPVALVSPGDSITLAFVFTNTSGVLPDPNNGSFIYMGLYNSGGSLPTNALSAAGLTSTAGSAFATGNCANWKGYVAGLGNDFSNSDRLYTRPVQNGAGTTSADQDLVGNNIGSGTFNNPTGVNFNTVVTNVFALATGAVFTNTMTIVLTDTNLGILTIINDLYDTTGAVVVGQTNSFSGTTNVAQSFDGLCIGYRCTLNSSGNFIMDIKQITVTKNISGLPGPSFNVTGGGSGCPGDVFAVSLSGSVATNDYYLYTNGVYDAAVAPQTGTGSPLVFGPISVVGTNSVLASNTVSGATGFMAGSAIISILPGPVITKQPSPVFVANNFPGVFTATVTGGGLGYQWYKNGTALTDGGEFSGSLTATLNINPATSADAATAANGYYVVITNICGLSATSTTNGLTIQSPGNIVWQGGNPNKNWDLATTTNFTAGGTPVVFNSGDNVTFDNSSTNPVVTLTGILEPTSVVVDRSDGITNAFTGIGSIAGPGTLLVNNGAELIVSNANTYYGGTTVGNGVLILRNAAHNALGGGLVTLAGGELEYGVSDGSTTNGITNINVSASSTVQLDVGGTEALVVLDVLTGAPSATLTTYNNAAVSLTASTRMRVYGAFTNDGSIFLGVEVNNAAAGPNVFEYATYNPSGNQVYNGQITGTGGRFTIRGNGNVIFNNANNNFNDSDVTEDGAGPHSGAGPGTGLYGYSVLISTGNVGIGADSSPDFTAYQQGPVASTGSSPLGTGILGINSGPSEGGNCSLFASGGAHTIANPILYTTANTNVTLSITGTNNLTLSGIFNLNGADNTGNTNRIIQVNNTGLTTISGVITDNGLNCGLTKTGTNALYLDATNTYTGSTIVSNGILAGVGVISGPVVVAGTGTIAGGDSASIGALTINNDLTLGASALFKVNKSVAPSNDVIVVTGALNNTGTGTLTVSNLGPALVVGDRFVVFSKALGNGAAMTVSPAPGAGLAWSNNLAVDGSIFVIVSAGPVTPILQTAPTASSITSGQSLSASTLSGGSVTNAAGASVTGSFAFTTPSTTPGVGTSSQSVTFTPTDTVTYNSFTFNVNVTVIAPAPVAGFSGTPTNIFVTQTVAFTDASTGSITNWIWNFGDGSASVTNTTSASVNHAYAVAGSYTVSLIANGSGGSNTSTKTAYIVVKPKPVFGKPVLSGGSLILGGVNGPVGQQYRILTSTNVALAIASWTPVYTNVVAADGSYGYTNSSLAGKGTFFLLVSP